ncbi:unnamed protein product [Medioppia subpectinata]|uniref:Uncharacterized protein n=1 Tax=Medioppia subpectinata TaxID=1979941 RepID=A0A7R9LDW7_9ACAR|nr:unnamed protein product [Medioppia subpectinata]CAG2117980.1 unnamed protein product [Medioppia subpectinata]
MNSRPAVRLLSSGGLNVALAVKDPLVRTDMSAIATAKVTGFEVVTVTVVVSDANAMAKHQI